LEFSLVLLDENVSPLLGQLVFELRIFHQLASANDCCVSESGKSISNFILNFRLFHPSCNAKIVPGYALEKSEKFNFLKFSTLSA
jgi:hypothetical protein